MRQGAALTAAALLVLATLVAVLVPRGGEAAQSTTRTYYIAAVETAWNYAPAGENLITGEEFGEDEDVFVEQGEHRIGSVYRKALYREYTDSSFATPKPVPPAWEHLGALGPLVRGEVGDTIRIVFKNKLTIPASVHAHGVFYAKSSEGAGYADGTSSGAKADDVVAPGGTHTYTWEVPERAGPSKADGSTVLWMYHSHVDEPRDENAGLIGPMIIGRRGSLRADGTPKDVDRELVTMFKVYDENASQYLEHNVEIYAGDPGGVDLDDEEFVESNLMHTINGYVYGNQPGLVMRKGERVRWYLMGMGTEVDLHTPHWHGQTVEVMGMRTDVAELLPASMKVADMQPDNAGTWLYHCHVNDHITAGMLSLFTVEP